MPSDHHRIAPRWGRPFKFPEVKAFLSLRALKAHRGPSLSLPLHLPHWLVFSSELPVTACREQDIMSRKFPGFCQLLNSPHTPSLESAFPNRLPHLTRSHCPGPGHRPRGKGVAPCLPGLAGTAQLLWPCTNPAGLVSSPVRGPQVEQMAAAGCLLFIHVDFMPYLLLTRI